MLWEGREMAQWQELYPGIISDKNCFSYKESCKYMKAYILPLCSKRKSHTHTCKMKKMTQAQLTSFSKLGKNHRGSADLSKVNHKVAEWELELASVLPYTVAQISRHKCTSLRFRCNTTPESLSSCTTGFTFAAGRAIRATLFMSLSSFHEHIATVKNLSLGC